VVNPSFDFSAADHFTAGAIGEPGQRTFYLQVSAEQRLVSLKCEKEQVGALAEYLGGVLADLPPVEGAGADMTLRSPVEPDWAAGTLSVGYDETSDEVVLVIEELIPATDPDAPETPEPEPASLRVRLSRGQVAAYVEHAAGVVAAGRPPCPLCGRPKGPDHICPRTNGHRPAV
jgi:uncharacterized repeat protein (TIGR03847 family)